MTLTRTLMLALALAALGACATGEIEKPSTNQGITMHFKSLDKNGDGFITPDEIPPNMDLLINFPRYDLNGDGAISEYEFREYIESINED